MSKNSNRGISTLIAIGIIAVLVVVVGGGIYWWANQKQSELNNEIFSLRTQAGMQRYQSVHGFQIDYPKNWRISSTIDKYASIVDAQRVGGNHFSIYSYPENKYNPGAPVPSNEIKIETLVYDNITATSVDEWINSFNIENVLRTEGMTINGAVAKKILYNTEGPGGTVLAVFYLNGNKGVRFLSWPSDTQYSQEFDSIVKTFNFGK